MSTDKIEISINDLARMEAHFQQGLQICYRLKKQLGSSAGPSSRKGLDENSKAAITGNRRKNILRKVS